ncbi:MAG: metallophosphoesterase family protein [Chloroflexi bacterium]|nr:metallophosphoesterase family protein [Chloroflexota bacterium]
MKIGILSDTHNNPDNTRTALATFRERGIQRLIHCGDITTPPIVRLFTGWDVVFVYGNMDSDWVALMQAIRAIGAPRPQLSLEVEVGDMLIGVTHGADSNLLFRLQISGKYAYVCHGHTHQRRNEFRSAYGVRVINPGALGGNRPETRSVCILDTASGNVEFIEFPDLR